MKNLSDDKKFDVSLQLMLIASDFDMRIEPHPISDKDFNLDTPFMQEKNRNFEPMEHRGRIQAQGENLEASETWAQNKPPTKKDGFDMLAKLKNKIPKKEAEKRTKAFTKAERFIEQAADNGGVNAPASVSLIVKGSTKERIDIEIRKGLAFIPTK